MKLSVPKGESPVSAGVPAESGQAVPESQVSGKACPAFAGVANCEVRTEASLTAGK